MAACNHCNTLSPEGAKFCLECGRPLPAAADEGRACSSCGQTLTRPVKYCTFCGARQGGTQDEIESPVNPLSARLEIKSSPSEHGYETKINTGRLGEDPGRVTKRIEPSGVTAATAAGMRPDGSPSQQPLEIPDTDPLSLPHSALPPTQRVAPADRGESGRRRNKTALVMLLLLLFATIASAAGVLIYRRLRNTLPAVEPASPQTTTQSIPSNDQPPTTPPPSPALSSAPSASSGDQTKSDEQQQSATGENQSNTGTKTGPAVPAPPPSREEQQRAAEKKAAEEASREEQRRAEEEQRRLQALREAADRRQRELAATPRSGNFHWRGRVDGIDEIVIRRDTLSIRHIEAQPVSESSYSFSSPLPPFVTKVELQGKRGRGKARVVQAPAPSNDFTLIVRIEDPKGGSEWLEFTVRWEVVER